MEIDLERSRKRSEAADNLPADKRPCSSSSEFRPPGSPSSSSTQHELPLPSTSQQQAALVPPPSSSSSQPDCDLDEQSDHSDQGGDSPYNSCDSDRDPDVGYVAGGDPGPSGRGAKFLRILPSLEDGAGHDAQLAGLTELCEILSFCMEDSLHCFPMDTSLPLLVRLAEHETNPEIMLLSVRAITYLCDVMPRSADAVVRHGAVPVLCQRLLVIEYLDVAEQCLQALEKISRRQPVPCLQAGAITAVLSYLDFFSTSIQRVALSTVANMCKKLPLDCSSVVMESVPKLCNLLQYEDRKLVETVATCLIRITDCFSYSLELLDDLCKHGVIDRSLDLIAIDGRTSLNKTIYTGLVGLLTKLATRSLIAARNLLELNVSSFMKGILMAYGISSGTSYTILDDRQSNQLVHEVLKLLNQLIPPPARDGDDIELVMAKEKILVHQPEFLHQFSMDILPVSIQVVNSGANLYVCYGCVSIINNIVYFSTPDMLLNLLKSTNIPSFLAGLLGRKDYHVLMLALKIVEHLMQKLPDVCSSSFVKEGVIYAIDTLLENCSSPGSQQSSILQLSDNQVPARNVSRCLCYAFDSLQLSSSGAKACGLRKVNILTLAKNIKSTYFSSKSMDSNMGLTETLQKLKIYCAVLNDNVDDSSTSDCCGQKEEYLSHVLDQVIREVNGGEPMSTFEFIESGIVKSLAHYLSNGKYLQGPPRNCNITNNFLAVLKRLQNFTCILFSNTGQSWEEMLLTILVRKLQTALSSTDNFPVILSQVSKPRNIYADIPARCSTIHPCLKVHFLRDPGEMDVQDYDDVLTVQLSASLDEIAGYLWPKVRRNDSEKAKSTVKTSIRTVDIASGSRCVTDRDSFESTNSKTVQEPLFPVLSESLANEGSVSLPVETSKSRELPSETDLNSSSNADERVEHEASYPSPRHNDGRPRLTLFLEGKQLDCSLTLYQAILQEKIIAEPDIIVGQRLLHEVHKVTYKRAAEPKKSDPQMSCDAWQPSIILDNTGFAWQKLPFFSTLLLAELPSKLDKLNPSYDILFMLKVLEGLNRFSVHLLSYERSNVFAEGRINKFDELKVAFTSLPQSEFMNSKLTDKLEQQLQDPLASNTGSMPSWCSQLMAACPFLFSFEAKRKYFNLIAFGSSRTQHSQVQHSDSTDTGVGNERRLQSRLLSRKKFKVDRSNVLESAAKMMASHAHSKTVIEVEYNEEVGTGLGPTMEFYTLVSHEFQKVGMGIWREDQSPTSKSGETQMVGDCGFVVAPFGLFPRPWSIATRVSDGIQFSDVIKNFVLLGQLVANAIKDGRILDVPFSRVFYKLILEQELGIYDIQSFAPELGRTLLEFQALANKKRYLESVSREDSRDESELYFRNMGVEDLCLDFTLPGFSDYVLSDSNSKMVNIANLEEYVSLVVDATINSGISRQVEAFKSGFNEVFPLRSLEVFSEDELERLLCGEQGTWNFSELMDHIKFDHGYTASSPPVVSLLEIIQEFGCDQRRAFLQFVTGAPRLPPGGLASLSPKLTIVRKHCGADDMDLPSVMTCANYLKLPPYSSKETMKKRLLFAITEGQGSFHLS